MALTERDSIQIKHFQDYIDAADGPRSNPGED
jgi:hypothetical protein